MFVGPFDIVNLVIQTLRLQPLSFIRFTSKQLTSGKIEGIIAVQLDASWRQLPRELPHLLRIPPLS